MVVSLQAYAVCTSNERFTGSSETDNQSDLQVLDMLPGVVEPKEAVDIAAPRDGVLMKLLVAEGRSVSKNQVLAIMDNRVTTAAVSVATGVAGRQAEIELAEIHLQTTQRFLKRVEQAHQHQATSDVELDDAREEYEKAKSELAQAREQQRHAQAVLELERARLDAHNVRAPFDGRVLRVTGREGQSMTRSDGLLKLANIKTLRVDLYVPVQWFRKLEVGDQFWLSADAPVEREIPALLVAYEPVIDAGTNTFRCVFEIENQDESLPAGFVVRLVQPASK